MYTFLTQFRKILLSECPQCSEPKVFFKFEELEQHMRKQHELFCCKLCAKHLKVPCRNCVTRFPLADVFILLILGNGARYTNSTLRYSPMRGSGTIAKNWLDIGHKATQTTRLIVAIRFANSATTDIWITTNC